MFRTCFVFTGVLNQEPSTFQLSPPQTELPPTCSMYVLNDEQKPQFHSSHSLRVQHIPHSPLLLHHCLFIFPLAFLLHPQCSSVLMLKLNPSPAVWVANETSCDITSEMWEKKLNANPELWFRQQETGSGTEWMGHREREHEKIHIYIELLCLPVKSIDTMTTQLLNQLNLLAKDNIVNRTGWCHYWSGGADAFALLAEDPADKRSWQINQRSSKFINL